MYSFADLKKAVEDEQAWQVGADIRAAAPRVIELGYNPKPQQSLVHENAKRFTVLVCHRRWGKTYFSLHHLTNLALQCPNPFPRYGIFFPTMKQAYKVVWPYLKRLISKIPGAFVKSEAKMEVVLPNGALIFCEGLRDSDNERGQYLDGALLDEFCDIGIEDWQTVIFPMLLDRVGWALICGTPRGLDGFYTLYRKGIDGEPHWQSFLFDAYTSGHLPEGQLEIAKATLEPHKFRQEFLCDFMASSTNAVMLAEDIIAARKRLKPTEDALRGRPRIMGIDCSGGGADQSCIVRRWGDYVFPPIYATQKDNSAFTGLCASIAKEFKPDAIFMDYAFGAAIADNLREQGASPVVRSINFGGASDDERFDKKNAEMLFKLADHVKTDLILPSSVEADVLSQEMALEEYGVRSSGKIYRKPKKESQGGKSPDALDALILTYAQPVVVRDVAFYLKAMHAQQRRSYSATDDFI